MEYDDYERIKSIVGEIYEENSDIMSFLPIDVFKLARRMGFRIIKASERIYSNHKKAIEFQDINKDKEIFGFSFFDTSKEEYVIYIDDINAKKTKQNFSLAHEIGHIVLMHKDDGKENEIEADYFAGYLLCPDCICINSVIYQAICNSPFLLKDIFGISEDTSLIKFRHIMNRHNLLVNKINKYEIIILNCIEKPILNKLKKIKSKLCWNITCLTSKSFTVCKNILLLLVIKVNT